MDDEVLLRSRHHVAQFANTGIKLEQVEKAVVIVLVRRIWVSHSGEVEPAAFEVQSDQYLPDLGCSDDSGGLNSLPGHLQACAFKSSMIHGCQNMSEAVFVHAGGSIGSTVSVYRVCVNRACERSPCHGVNEWLYVVDPHSVVAAKNCSDITSGRNLNGSGVHQPVCVGISIIPFDPYGNLVLPRADVFNDSATGIGNDWAPVYLYANGPVVDVAYPQPGCVGVSVNDRTEDYAECEGVDVVFHCLPSYWFLHGAIPRIVPSGCIKKEIPLSGDTL